MDIKRTNSAHQISPTNDVSSERKETKSTPERTSRGVGDIQNSFENRKSESSKNNAFFPQSEWDWTQKNVQGMNSSDWLAPLFSKQQTYKEVASSGIKELNQLDEFQRNIMTEFAGLDLTKPENSSERRIRKK